MNEPPAPVQQSTSPEEVERPSADRADSMNRVPARGNGSRYQCFENTGSQANQGHDRSYLNDLVFAGGVEDQAVLDVGCNTGYFCIEALRRNAASATGIDVDPGVIGQAREISRLSGFAPEYLCGDLEKMDWQGRRFDTVICINVLHHLYDPLATIRTMIQLARRRIVIEFARPTAWDLLKRSGNPFVAAALSAPVIVVGDPGKSHDLSRSFLFTGKSMQVLFNGHTELFEPLTLHRSPFKGRQIAVVNRRHVSHIVVVAGPTSSGKSTLLERLQSDLGLRSSLGLDDVHWIIPANQHTPLPLGQIDGLVHHYDLLRPYDRSMKTYSRDPRCDLFEVADKITVVTLMSPPAVLRRRLVTSRKKAPWRSTRLSKRHGELYKHYGDPDFLQGWYEQWFAFCDRFADKISDNLLLIDDGGGSRIAPARTWREEYTRIN